MTFRRLSVLVTLLVSVAGVHLHAQPTGQPQAPASAEQQPQYSAEEQRIFEAIGRIREHGEKLEELDKVFAEAAGEARESTMLQRLDRYEQLVAELREFSSLVSSYAEQGGQPQVLLADFRDRLLNTGTKLRNDIGEYQRRYEGNTANRDTASPEGLKSYIFDNRLLDMGYSLLSEYVDVVESFGYNAGPSRAFLTDNTPGRAEALVGQIRLNSERETEFETALSLDKSNTEIQTKLRLVSDKQAADTKSLQLIIGIIDKLGLDSSSYRKLLVKTTGEISADLFDANVMSGLFYEWWLSAKQSMADNLVNFVLKVLAFLAILGLFKLLARLVKKLLMRSLESSSVNLSVLMQEMLTSMTSRIIMLLGILVALAQVGVSLGPVLAGLGVVGFVIGFALQDTLGNFAAGVMILFYRPYDVDDFVEAAGVFGKVKSMNIVSTTILTIDNQTLIIPNSKIWGDVIKNVTAQKVRRVDMTFGIGYVDNIEHAEKVLHDIVDKHQKVLASPEPMIKLHTLGESSVDFIVRPWAKTEDYWDVYWDITREVKLRFDAEGISIPFPQRDVHLYSEK